MKRFVLFSVVALFAVLLTVCDNAVIENEYYTNYVVQPRGIALSNAADLAKIGLDDGYPLDGAYYLAADIDLAGLEGNWAPIGTAEDPFSGILNGNGKTIRGFTLPGGETRYTGLFGCLYLARLSNLTIEVENTKVELTATTPAYATYSGAGVAAGYVKASNIDGVTIQGAAGAAAGGQLEIANDGSGDFAAGGFAGVLEDSTVSNITVNLTLKTSYPTTGWDQAAVGLVAGYSAGGSLASCVAEGSIEASSTTQSTLSVGGIVGRATTRLENCTSAVTKVYGESSGEYGNLYVGGIAGQSAGSLVSCGLEADHQVTIRANYTAAATGAYAGGISGYADGDINKCVVDAEVEILAETAHDTALYAGGIAGQSGNISSSFVRRGNVLAKTTNDASEYGKMIVAGGISGSLSGSEPAITNSFSNADVTVESAFKEADLDYSSYTAAGGIAGYMFYNTHIIKSGASGTVKTVSKSSEAGSAVFAGGIAGVASYYGITIEQNAALNGSVTVESAATTPQAYRILGGAINVFTWPAALYTPEEIPDIEEGTLYGNYALADLTVQTQTGSADPVDVSQANNAVSLTGSGTLTRTREFFAETLEWDFEIDWAWDDAANLPVPRYN